MGNRAGVVCLGIFVSTLSPTLAEGLDNPRMQAVADDGTVYVTQRTPGNLVMLRDTDGDGIVTAGLPDGGQHPNRTLAFIPDGELFVSVGSTCNECREPPVGDPPHRYHFQIFALDTKPRPAGWLQSPRSSWSECFKHLNDGVR
ncbi:hypothetical protein ACFPN2_07205 [Steroidobacter flavus]|uniref:Glucose/Sorbosone dehydrogenase domain-containing protein n=1 Tax=Steroidobacter flavus TaxID=1842136 RepID=A0ABV8SR33_9GAMM